MQIKAMIQSLDICVVQSNLIWTIQANTDSPVVYLLTGWLLQLGQDGWNDICCIPASLRLENVYRIAELLKKPEEAAWAGSHLKTLDENLEKHAWDGLWYLRAYRADGLNLAQRKCRSVYFSWTPTLAVISGHTSKEQSEKLLDIVNKPPFHRLWTDDQRPAGGKTDPQVIKSRYSIKGWKRTLPFSSIRQGWVVAAEAIIGREHGVWNTIANSCLLRIILRLRFAKQNLTFMLSLQTVSTVHDTVLHACLAQRYSFMGILHCSAIYPRHSTGL